MSALPRERRLEMQGLEAPQEPRPAKSSSSLEGYHRGADSHGQRSAASLTGTALIDLRHKDAHAGRAAVYDLSSVPAGCRAQILVGDLVDQLECLDFLREQTHRLHVEILGSPVDVPRWLDALRGELA